MQNRIHYFRWTAGLIVVTNSFLTGTKNDKYGNCLLNHFIGNTSIAIIYDVESSAMCCPDHTEAGIHIDINFSTHLSG